MKLEKQPPSMAFDRFQQAPQRKQNKTHHPRTQFDNYLNALPAEIVFPENRPVCRKRTPVKRWKKSQSLLLAARCCFVVVIGIAFQIGNKIAPNRLALNVKSQTRLGLLTSAFSVRGTTDTPVSCLQGRKKKRSRVQLGTVVQPCSLSVRLFLSRVEMSISKVHWNG